VAPTYYDDEKRKRMKAIFVDHIIPVVDPAVGWTTWDDCIERLFCEPENLQLLCKACHSEKSREEIDIAKKRRETSKEEQLELDEGSDIEEDE
jgi:5-methylcytosine-specific restriction endonuclease McrA